MKQAYSTIAREKGVSKVPKVLAEGIENIRESYKINNPKPEMLRPRKGRASLGDYQGGGKKKNTENQSVQ